MIRIAAMLAALLPASLLMACSPQGAAEPTAPAPAEEVTTHPISGLEVIPLTIDTGEAVHQFRVELAASAQAQTQGLMFRTEMGDDEGMLFPSGEPRFRSFWMRNTPLPLDLIFIAEDHTVKNIAAMAEPYSLESIPSDGPVIAVLELIGGRAEQLGIEPGHTVKW